MDIPNHKINAFSFAASCVICLLLTLPPLLAMRVQLLSFATSIILEYKDVVLDLMFNTLVAHEDVLMSHLTRAAEAREEAFGGVLRTNKTQVYEHQIYGPSKLHPMETKALLARTVCRVFCATYVVSILSIALSCRHIYKSINTFPSMRPWIPLFNTPLFHVFMGYLCAAFFMSLLMIGTIVGLVCKNLTCGSEHATSIKIA